MQALLELDCIPSGMELFPAANEDQWTLIRGVIDDCDYYIVVVGGRYGSCGPDGKSYTRMEYEYAVSRNKPVIAFLHKDPSSIAAGRSEQTIEGKRGLAEFRQLCETRMCKYWATASELGSVVSRSLIRLTRDHPAVGWIRADTISDAASEEILQLRRQVEELQLRLAAESEEPAEATEDLARGEDRIALVARGELYTKTTYERLHYDWLLEVSWNEVFAHVAPLMIEFASDSALRQSLNGFATDRLRSLLQTTAAEKDLRPTGIAISDGSYRTIMVQFRALNLIAKRERQKRGVHDNDTYWTLTSYGDRVMTRLRALRRPISTPTVDVTEEHDVSTD